MFYFTQAKTPVLLGVDIGSAVIKIVGVSAKNHHVCIESYGCATIPPPNNNPSYEYAEVLAETLRSLLVSIRCLPTKKVALAIPDRYVTNKKIQFNSSLTEENIETWLLNEWDNHMVYPVTESYFDFTLLAASETHASMVDIQFVAAKQEEVNTRLQLLQRVGLKPCFVDIESLAIARAAYFILSSLSSHAIALVELGAAHIRVIGFFKKHLLFFREEALNDPSDLAATCAPPHSMMATAAQKNTRETNRFDSFCETIALQIEALLHAFTPMLNQKNTTVFLIGGRAGDLKLTERLKIRLSMPINSLRFPMSVIETASCLDKAHIVENMHFLMVAYGLALRCGE